ncbi:MAG: hypothetical protein AAF602_12300 [Myxococcota bacterium]
MALQSTRFLLDVFSVLRTTGDGSGGPVGQLTIDQAFANGVGANQADGRLFDVRSLAASGVETINLQTILDENGNALNAAEVVVFVLQASSANGGNLQIDVGLTDPWTDLLGASGQHDLRPGAALVLFSTADGAYPIASSARTFDVENLDAGGTASYTLYALVRTS